VAIRAVVVLDRVAQRAVAFHQRFRERRGIVGGIVEDLNLQQVLRVLDPGHFFDQPLHHVTLVIQRKLNGDWRRWSNRRGGSVTAFFRCLK
jgi:hypothetical protein